MLKDVKLKSEREASDLLFNVNKFKQAGASLKAIRDYLIYQILSVVVFALLTFAWIGFAVIGFVISILLTYYILSALKEGGDALSSSIKIKEEAKF